MLRLCTRSLSKGSVLLSHVFVAGETLRLRVCNQLPSHMDKTNGEDTNYATHTQPMTVSASCPSSGSPIPLIAAR